MVSPIGNLPPPSRLTLPAVGTICCIIFLIGTIGLPLPFLLCLDLGVRLIREARKEGHLVLAGLVALVNERAAGQVRTHRAERVSREHTHPVT